MNGSASQRADSHRGTARLLLLLTVVVWGATFTLVKSALTDVSPLLFNLLRMTLAAAVLLAINARRLKTIRRHDVMAGLAAGLFLAAGYQLQTLGLARTTPAKSAFLTGFVVVFVPLLTLVPRFRPRGASRPGWSALGGAVIAFAGLVLLTAPAGVRGTDLRIGPGDLLSLLCALAFAAHLLTLGHFAKGMSAGVLATLQIGFCAVFMLISLPAEHFHVSFTPRLVVTLAVCSVLATAAAFTIQSFAQQHLAPTETVLLLTLEPVFAAVTGRVFLHDALSGRALAGAGLILCGLLLIDLLPNAQSTEIPA